MKRLLGIFTIFASLVSAQVAHPRIWLDSTTMARLRSQIASSHYSGTASVDSPQLTAFLATVNTLATRPVVPYDRFACPDYTICYSYQGSGWGAAMPLALAYRITGSTTYSDKVKEILNVMADTGRVLSLTSVSGISPGMAVTGTNIPGGATVVSVNPSGNAYNTYPQVTLSNWFTGDIPNGTTITFNGAITQATPTSGSYLNFGPANPEWVDGGYASRNSVVALAIGYDWIYDQLSSQNKTDFAHVLDAWWTEVNLSGYQWANASYGATDNGCGNYSGGDLMGFGLGAIAFEGDDSNTTAIFNDATYGIVTRLNNRFLPQITSGCFTSGFPSESYSYGSGTLIRLAQTLWAFQTAGKSSLIGNFDMHPFLQQIALSTIYAEHPDNWGVNDEGDWAGQYVGILGQGLPYVISGMLGSGYSESSYALYQYSQINLAGVPGGAPGPSYGYTLDSTSAFLYNQPTATPTDYSSILPLYRFGNGKGDYHTFSRTDWTSSAVYSSFNGGNGAMTDHQSRAFGHLYVQRGVDRLLVNAGQWAGTGGVNGTHSFTLAGWGSNMLFVADSNIGTSGAGYGYLFCDPSRVGYGCVQGGAADAPLHEENSTYLFSKANLGGSYGNRGNFPLSTYFRSYVNIGGVSFVYDYSVAVNYATATRKQFWHTPALTTATPAGIASAINVTGTIGSATVGASKLWVKPVYPTAATITAVPDLQNYVGSQQMTQRFEVNDPNQSSSATTQYLTVLAATESTRANMPTTTLIDAGAMKGASYDDGVLPRVVLFAATNTLQVSINYATATLSGTVRHVLAGISPGAYNIYQNGTQITTATASANGVMTFTSTGGGVFSSTPGIPTLTVAPTSGSTLAGSSLMAVIYGGTAPYGASSTGTCAALVLSSTLAVTSSTGQNCTVTVTDASAATATYSASFAAATLAVAPPSGSTIWSSGATLTATISGGTAPYHASSSGTCAATIVFSSTLSVTAPSPQSCTVTITDSGTQHVTYAASFATPTLTVNPTSGTVAWSSGITLTAAVSGGTAPYHTAVLSGTCGASIPSTTLIVTSTKGQSCTVGVYDSGSNAATYSATFTVLPLAVTPNSGSVSWSIGATLTATVSGGATPYTAASTGSCAASIVSTTTLSVTAPSVQDCTVTVTEAGSATTSYVASFSGVVSTQSIYSNMILKNMRTH